MLHAFLGGPQTSLVAIQQLIQSAGGGKVPNDLEVPTESCGSPLLEEARIGHGRQPCLDEGVRGFRIRKDTVDACIVS